MTGTCARSRCSSSPNDRVDALSYASAPEIKNPGATPFVSEAYKTWNPFDTGIFLITAISS